MEEVFNDEEFKTPGDKFVQELDALEKYNNKNADSIARMSLFKQFDPLVSQSQCRSSNIPSNVPESSHVEDNNCETTDMTVELNQSATLIQVNSPFCKKNFENSTTDIKQNNNEVNQSHISNNDQQIIQMNEEIGFLESKNETYELLLAKILFLLESTVDLSAEKISALFDSFENNRKKTSKLLVLKNQLEEDINSIEKNYYEIHSRYDSLRSLVKEMDARESNIKEKLVLMSTKLQEKEQECRELKKQAEEAIESANNRIQNMANNDTVSLKAQIKVLEMKVNSLQTQIQQKNRENDELSNIVNELIANRN